MKTKLIAAVLHNLLLSLFIVSIMGVGYGIFAFVMILALSLVPKPEVAGLHNEVIRTIFSSELAKKLFPANDFVEGVTMDTEIGNEADSFEIPQETITPEVIKDATQFPLAVSDSKNTKKSYEAHHYSTKPHRVGRVEQLITSYNKLSNLVDLHSKTLMNYLMNDLLFFWATNKAANIVETSGTATATSARIAGMTGNRKVLQKADFDKAFTLLAEQDVPIDGRGRIVIHPQHYREVLAIANFVEADKAGFATIPTGVIGKLYGMNVYMRSTVPRYAADGVTPKNPNEAVAADDKLGIKIFHPDFVRMGMGAINPYINQGDATMQGDVISTDVKGGGTHTYEDQIGVVEIVQG